MDKLAKDQSGEDQDPTTQANCPTRTHDRTSTSLQHTVDQASQKGLSSTVKQHVIHVVIFSMFFNVLLFSSPIYMLQIYNRILPARAEESLINITFLVVFMLMTMGVLDAVRQLTLLRLARKVESAIGKKALNAALMPPRRGGATINHQQILCDIDQLRSLLTKGHLLHVFDALWLPGFLIALTLLHPWLAIVALVGIATLCALGIIGHAVVTPAAKKANGNAMRVFSIADRMMMKADVLRGLGMAPAMTTRWDAIREDASAYHMIAGQRLGLLTAASKALKVIFQSITLGVGAYLAIHDAISAGAIVAGSILMGRVLGPIEASILAWHEILRAWESHHRLTDLRHSERLAPSHTIMAPSNGALIVEHLSCDIDNRVILRDVNFEAEPGQIVAIIGPSGAGKTTLAKHLVGAWSGVGTVRLDGLDISSMTEDAKRRFVGYLPQEGHLFDGSVIETISRFGEASAQQILQTAELTGIHEMILRLPDDYGTNIGVDGSLLSGGQRQRLALARALYGDPVLIVLDEPCAHLDEISERRLIQTLRALKKRKATICLVTHKINFIHLADRVLVLNANGDVRFGPPQDLFSRNLRPVPTKAAAG